jgi:hypothetical protein
MRKTLFDNKDMAIPARLYKNVVGSKWSNKQWDIAVEEDTA